jgi:hypothetical protein
VGTTGLAVKGNMAILNLHLGFWILALLAENELGNEAIEIVLQFGGLVCAVDNPTIIGRIGIGLGTEFEAEVFDQI